MRLKNRKNSHLSKGESVAAVKEEEEEEEEEEEVKIRRSENNLNGITFETFIPFQILKFLQRLISK